MNTYVINDECFHSQSAGIHLRRQTKGDPRAIRVKYCNVRSLEVVSRYRDP